MKASAFIVLLLLGTTLVAQDKDKEKKKGLGAKGEIRAGAPTVLLNWTVSNSTGSNAATSQQVFRGTAAGGENYTTPITTINDNTTKTYTDADPTLTRGSTYYYTAKACNTAGCSTPSNEASATIPNAPNPQTGLTAQPQ